MVQWVKTIAKKTGNLSSMSGTQKAGPEESCKLLSDFCMAQVCIDTIN